MWAGLMWRRICPTGSYEPDKDFLTSVNEWEFTGQLSGYWVLKKG